MRLEIILDMLRAIRDGTDKPAKIMYNMNMTGLLSKLVDEGHIKMIKTQGPKRVQRRYEITKKGFKVIDYLKGAEGLIKIG
jgi:predicted transcriptional regulator